MSAEHSRAKTIVRRKMMWVALPLGALACGGDTVTSGHQQLVTPARLVIAAPIATGLIADGGSLQLHATVFGSDGAPLPLPVPTWTSSVPDRMTITSDGLATPLKAGPVVVRVTLPGYPLLSDSLAFTVDEFVSGRQVH